MVHAKDHRRLAHLHESLAALLASRGQWRQAYEHLRSALDLSRDPDGAAAESPEAQAPEGLRRELERLRRAHAEAREQSLRDSLTASYNRRYLDQRLDDLVASKPAGTGLALALVDLDFFKRVNDTHGHQLGDQVLQRVVEVLQAGLPEGAFCARYGGEEFVLVMPDVGEAAAVVVCEAARARVEHHPWDQLVAGLQVTVSIGIAHRDEGPPADVDYPGGPQRRISGVPELLMSADQLLYQAKQSGRNAVAYLAEGRVALAGMAARRRNSPGARSTAPPPPQ
ncbi:MAG: GGDEF domain-containing protein [Actinobacteria bacterium]|nr:GGDEF domain-containing protein [Actinomycetota bacterium]